MWPCGDPGHQHVKCAAVLGTLTLPAGARFEVTATTESTADLDSGVDFWTAYLFHTRDMVRQTGVDLFQVVRVLKSFDGVKTWRYDANLDGQPDLAGDLNGDDLGSLLINQMIRYIATNGEQLDFDPCQLDWTCSWLPPIR